jgi:hypothetical protein
MGDTRSDSPRVQTVGVGGGDVGTAKTEPRKLPTLRRSATARPSCHFGRVPTTPSFCRAGPDDTLIMGRAIDVAPQNLMDLGRGRAYRRTLLNDVPTEAQYLETRKAELTIARLAANVWMTQAKYCRQRSFVEGRIPLKMSCLHFRIPHSTTRSLAAHLAASPFQ